MKEVCIWWLGALADALSDGILKSKIGKTLYKTKRAPPGGLIIDVHQMRGLGLEGLARQGAPPPIRPVFDYLSKINAALTVWPSINMLVVNAGPLF